MTARTNERRTNDERIAVLESRFADLAKKQAEDKKELIKDHDEEKREKREELNRMLAETEAIKKQVHSRLPFMPTAIATTIISALSGALGYCAKWIGVLLKNQM